MTTDLIWIDDTYAADQARFEAQEGRLADARAVGERIRAENWQETPDLATREHMPFPHHRTCAEWGPKPLDLEPPAKRKEAA